MLEIKSVSGGGGLSFKYRDNISHLRTAGQSGCKVDVNVGLSFSQSYRNCRSQHTPNLTAERCGGRGFLKIF